MKELIVAIQAMFQQTFTYLDKLAASVLKKAESQKYTVNVENLEQVPVLDITPVVESIDGLSRRLAESTEPAELRKIQTLLESLGKAVSGLAKASRDAQNTADIVMALEGLGERLDELKPTADTTVSDILREIRDSLGRLNVTVPEPAFSDSQFQQLLNQFQELATITKNTKQPTPQHMTGGMPVLNANGLRISPATEDTLTSLKSSLVSSGQVQFAAIDISSSGDNTIVVADSDRRIKILSYVFVCDGDVDVQFKSGAGNALSGAMPCVANSGVASPVSSVAQGPLLQTSVNEAFVINLSDAVGVKGHLSYYFE